MFLFPAEAERMLEGVLKAPNGASSGAKVFQTNLDRAFKLARLEPMQSGLRDQVTNRELTMVWQFMPHAAEQTRAQVRTPGPSRGVAGRRACRQRTPSVPPHRLTPRLRIRLLADGDGQECKGGPAKGARVHC